MKKIFYFLSFLLISNLFSQNIPKLQINDNNYLKLSELKININIVGNYAQTTYDMTFYNPYNRTLEGELVFPLPQGSSVSNFAMEINGKMREAVVVEKTKARIAYKNTMIQRIDPGLLEKIEGNNYKTRIYPIRPKSHKHIIISTEQQLNSENSEKIYSVILNYPNKLQFFEINANITSSNKPNINPKPFVNFHFKKKKGIYTAHWSGKNYKPDKSFRIIIPETYQQPELITYKDFFYLYIPLQKNYKQKPQPHHISVFWDASLSGLKRETYRDIKLLLDYIKYLRNVNVDLYVFSSDIQQSYSLKINNGKTKILKNILHSITYDGGTNFSLLNQINTTKTDEILLFSDGLNNFGDWTNLPNKPIYTINSGSDANHNLLQQIADITGGNYINLTVIDNQTALDNLQIITLKYLGIDNKPTLFEVYPIYPKTASGSFVLAGRFTKPEKFTINFGYKDKNYFSYQIDLSNAEKSILAKRLWAIEKLKFLSLNPKKNKEKIVSLAIRNHLISDYTSMIILDRIEDYIRYGIEPPDDLKSRYKELMSLQAKNKENPKEKQEKTFSRLQIKYHKLLNWYYNDKQPSNEDLSNNENNNLNETNQNEVIGNDRTENIPRRHNTRLFTGFVYDKSNPDEPLPGVYINIKGTNIGTVTDFDGKFIINVKTGDTLIISYLGYKSVNYVVNNENTTNIYLEESEGLLERVVINAIGIEVNKVSERSVSVSHTRSNNQEKNISSTNTTSDKILIRGSASILLNDKPLFLKNNKIINKYDVKKINPDNIGKILIVKPPLSITIYGYQARYGAILIFTKKYLNNHLDEIEKLENLIEKNHTLTTIEANTKYIQQLKKTKNIEEAYQLYIKKRLAYMNKPLFFIEVSDYFFKRGNEKLAIRIITNLLELKLANHELSRALAYKLETYNKNNMAVKVYQNVLELRPEEPQSYRDLALAYEQVGEYQKSFDLLYNIYKGKYTGISGNSNYSGIEKIAFVELKHLVNMHGDKIKLPDDAYIFKKPMPLDIRVVIDWNHNDTDIDLWVFDPNDEKAYYGHKFTKIGGRMSDDFTQGYGPETYILKNAIEGIYNFEINYFADQKQKISGPTLLKVTIFKNYGRPNETRKVLLTKLDKNDTHAEVGSIKF